MAQQQQQQSSNVGLYVLLASVVAAGAIVASKFIGKGGSYDRPPDDEAIRPKTNGGSDTMQAISKGMTAAEQVADAIKKLFGGAAGGSPQTGGTGGGTGGGQGQIEPQNGAKKGKGTGGKDGTGVKKGNNPNSSDLAAGGYTEMPDGRITNAQGYVGTRDSSGGIEYLGGSYQYPSGTLWDPQNGTVTFSDGSITDKYGNQVGHYNQDKTISPYENAMFDGEMFLGFTNGDGTYTDPDGERFDQFTGEVAGFTNYDGTWEDTEGWIWNENNQLVGQSLGDGEYYLTEDGRVIDSYYGDEISYEDYQYLTGDDWSLEDYLGEGFSDGGGDGGYYDGEDEDEYTWEGEEEEDGDWFG